MGLHSSGWWRTLEWGGGGGGGGGFLLNLNIHYLDSFIWDTKNMHSTNLVLSGNDPSWLLVGNTHQWVTTYCLISLHDKLHHMAMCVPLQNIGIIYCDVCVCTWSGMEGRKVVISRREEEERGRIRGKEVSRGGGRRGGGRGK